MHWPLGRLVCCLVAQTTVAYNTMFAITALTFPPLPHALRRWTQPREQPGAAVTIPNPRGLQSQRASTADYNARHEAHWRSGYEEHATHSYAFDWQLNEEQQSQASQQQQQFQRRVQRRLPSNCPCCWAEHGPAGHGSALWTLEDGCEGALTYVAVLGSVSVDLPRYVCTQCAHDQWLGPMELGCFPSTPQRVTAFYDEELLRLTSRMRSTAAYSASAWRAVLQEQHKENGLPSPPAVLEELSRVVVHWANIQEMKRSSESLQVPSIRPGGWTECPACWRSCVALSGDACLGMRHYRLVAGSSSHLHPTVPGPFLRDAFVAQQLASYRAPAATSELSSCGDFRAATTASRKAATYDHMGIAAFVCRHGFVVSATSMQSEENYLYYELMLDDALPKLDRAALKAVFLDVACKFEPFWRARWALVTL